MDDGINRDWVEIEDDGVRLVVSMRPRRRRGLIGLLYHAVGRDVVIAEPGFITLREEAFGLGLNSRHPVEAIAAPEFEDRFKLVDDGFAERRIGDNSLWFEVKGKLRPMGSGLGLEQAERLRRSIMMRAKK